MKIGIRSLVLFATFAGGLYLLFSQPLRMVEWGVAWAFFLRLAVVQRQQVELAELVKRAHEVQAANHRTILASLERLRRQ